MEMNSLEQTEKKKSRDFNIYIDREERISGFAI